MLGFILSETEAIELESLIKRELDCIRRELDGLCSPFLKRALEERYRILFRLLQRVVPEQECMKQIRRKKENTDKNFF